MSEASVKIKVDASEATAELKKLGGQFENLANETKNVGGAAKQADSQIASMAKGFITFELAKKVGEFAMATLRAAKDMEGLSTATKESAANLTGIVDGVKSIGQSMVLWVSSLGSSKGILGSVASQVKDIAESWAYLSGGQTPGEQIAEAANPLADLPNLILQFRESQKAYDAAIQSDNDNFIEEAGKGSEETEKMLRDYAEKKKIDVETLLKLSKDSTRGTKEIVELLKKGDAAVSKTASRYAESKPGGDAASKKAAADAAAAKAEAQFEKDFAEYRALLGKAYEELQAEAAANAVSLQNVLDMEAELYQAETEYIRAETEYIRTELEQQAADKLEFRIREINNARYFAEQQAAILMSAQPGLQSMFVAIADDSKNAFQIMEDSFKTAIKNMVATLAANAAILGIANLMGIGPAVNTAMGISNQNPGWLNFSKLLGFADGGLVPGSSYAGDSMLIRANSGERVLTAAQNQRWEQGLGATVNLTYSPTIQGTNTTGLRGELRRGRDEMLSMVKQYASMSNTNLVPAWRA